MNKKSSFSIFSATFLRSHFGHHVPAHLVGAVPAQLGCPGLARSLSEGQPPFGAPRPSFLDLLRTVLFLTSKEF